MSDTTDPGKRDKSSVNYRKATGEQRCKTCRYMTMGGMCRRVKGSVEPDDVCDLWDGKRG